MKYYLRPRISTTCTQQRGRLAVSRPGGAASFSHCVSVCSLTPCRAVVVNAQVQRGQNILITGIGGGVALLAMQICLALGVNVWVTSGSKHKLEKAVQVGAKGGVNYKDGVWFKSNTDLNK